MILLDGNKHWRSKKIDFVSCFVSACMQTVYLRDGEGAVVFCLRSLSAKKIWDELLRRTHFMQKTLIDSASPVD